MQWFAGYQFFQARGLIVLDTPIGLVAVLPIGMAQVSSVAITAQVGVSLRKGEEISYFQFGGSDLIVLFEAASNVSFTAQPGVHYKMGTRIGRADPVRSFGTAGAVAAKIDGQSLLLPAMNLAGRNSIADSICRAP